MTDSDQRLVGKPMSKAELLQLIDEIRMLIELDDSFEGLLNWLMPNEDSPPDTYALVEARYRVGNSMGQGGFQIIGDWVDKQGHRVQHVDPGKGLGGARDALA